MKKFLILPALFLYFSSYSQNHTISGIVKDAENLEFLIGANVYEAGSLKGTTSNNYGFYSLTLPRDTVRIRYSFVGYTTREMKFFLDKDTVINVLLSSNGLLDEVVVSSDKEEAIQETTQMSAVKLPASQIKAMPALLGEPDVLKVLQLLPGVQSGNEGSSGIYVRGGGPDQNLILLDGVPVYNASHLFGFFSVFNSVAINNVELIKGGFPARYGGRLSSVIDMQAKEGNMKKFQGEGSVGLIASKLTLEGPIKKERSSFIISARRTYADLLFRPVIKQATDEQTTSGYYFYDLNAKVNYKLTDRDRIYLSAYMGNDKAYARNKDFYYYDDNRVDNSDEFGLYWGNITSALRWNHILNNKLFSNTTLTYSRYRFNIFGESTEKRTGDENVTEYYKERYYSQIRDFAGKVDFDYIPSPNQFIKFGVSATQHEFRPGAATYKSDVENEKIDSTFGAKPISAWEFSGYIEDDIKLGDNLKVNLGIHASGFEVRDKFFHSFQPRVAMRYLLNPSLSIKASYAEMQQYIHLLTNSGIGLPTDLWVPATDKIEPQRSRQFALGLAKNFNQSYEISLEGYYKKMNRLIEYKEGASYLNITENWEDKVEVGDGESYGAELFLQKKFGDISGWIGYTLSWSNRTFPNINYGETFPYKYDRRHDISITMVKSFGEHFDFSMAWVFGTGNAVSLPVSKYPPSEERNGWWSQDIKYYGGRNQYRMRDYHRLDLAFTFKRETKWGERSWSIGAYNAYNRKNPFFMDIGSDGGRSKFVQYSLFPFLPSIRYSAKF